RRPAAGCIRSTRALLRRPPPAELLAAGAPAAAAILPATSPPSVRSRSLRPVHESGRDDITGSRRPRAARPSPIPLLDWGMSIRALIRMLIAFGALGAAGAPARSDVRPLTLCERTGRAPLIVWGEVTDGEHRFAVVKVLDVL